MIARAQNKQGHCQIHMVEGSLQWLPPIPVLYDYLSITVARFGEGSPLQMIFITLVARQYSQFALMSLMIINHSDALYKQYLQYHVYQVNHKHMQC